MLLQVQGKSCALLANSHNQKNHFPAGSFPHKETGFLSPPLSFCSLLFFFFSFSPQPHTIVNTMMAALKHWSGSSEQDRTPPPPCALFWILHWSQLSGCERWRHLHPLPFLDRKQSDSGFFPPFFFCLSWFPYFISYRLFQVKEVPLWCNTSGFFFCVLCSNCHMWSVFQPNRLSNMHTANSSVLFWHALTGWRTDSLTYLLPGSFLERAERQHSSLSTDTDNILGLTCLPRPTSCWHRPRGLEEERGSNVKHNRAAVG